MACAPHPSEPPAAAATLPLSLFFPANAGPAALQLPSLPAHNCLLAGPTHSGKTTLLFNFAVNTAAQGGRAVFICRRERLEAAPPLFAPERAPGDALQRVDMRYLSDDRDLRRWCASMHLLSTQPHCIAVDDLSQFVDARTFPDRRAREAALAKALALLHEAAAHASGRHAAAAALAGGDAARRPPPRCQLLVTERGGSEGEGPPLLFVYQRWLPLILAGRVRSDGAGGTGGFSMSLLPTESGPRDPSGTAVRYSLSSAAVLLDGVETRS